MFMTISLIYVYSWQLQNPKNQTVYGPVIVLLYLIKIYILKTGLIKAKIIRRKLFKIKFIQLHFGGDGAALWGTVVYFLVFGVCPNSDVCFLSVPEFSRNGFGRGGGGAGPDGLTTGGRGVDTWWGPGGGGHLLTSGSRFSYLWI